MQTIGRPLLDRADRAANAVYTWKYNPLYHTGALAVCAFLVLLVTGLYLLLFYRISSPYGSVEGLAAQWWGGRWIRSLHRYASDLAIVAIVIHAVRMFLQGRTWGPRALAWLSGLVLTAVFLVCGWTGYVMVWDQHGQLIAQEGARIMDALPLFGEPIRRTFGGEYAIPNAFFFLNLFAHILLPVGVGLVLWIHVSRLARTYWMPPRALFWGTVGLFVFVSAAWPAPIGAPADLLRTPGLVPFDVLYGFWLPLTRTMEPGTVWLAGLALVAVLASVPFLMRPPPEKAPPVSWVNPRFCTGCEQCYLDCPYEAIQMVARDDGRAELVGVVDPAKCVSCGICAGSCAPMGVGPIGRTGRDQLTDVRTFIEREKPGADDIVIVGCHNAVAGGGTGDLHGALPFEVSCAGSVHTSVIEYLVRAGAGGVLLATCPPRDCWNREGVAWMEERIYNEREAELKDRVDRRRLRVLYAGAGESHLLRAELQRFRAQMQALERALGEREIQIDDTCEVPVPSNVEELR